MFGSDMSREYPVLPLMNKKKTSKKCIKSPVKMDRSCDQLCQCAEFELKQKVFARRKKEKTTQHVN